MKKLLVVISLLASLLLVTTSILAFSNIDLQSKSKLNKDNEPVDKTIFIHYKDGSIVGIGRVQKSPTCYALEGVKWNSLPINYVIGPNALSIVGSLTGATKTWDDATSKSLFGSYSTDLSARWETNTPDYKNSYVFGPYSNNNVIAVTNVWYTRYGKQIVDYDVLFNTYYNWKDCTTTICDTSTTSKDMDLQDIATHETGHGLGLGDVYNAGCSQVTMYGYATPGETQKRSLETADIKGIQRIYGKIRIKNH